MKSITRLFDLLDLYKDEYGSKKDAFVRKEYREWRKFSSKEYVDISNLISLGLHAMGIRKATVLPQSCIIHLNGIFFDMGIMQLGAVQVPIYPPSVKKTMPIYSMMPALRFLSFPIHRSTGG